MKRCGVVIRGLWERHTDAKINGRLGNADVDTYRFEPMQKFLDRWDKMKKDNHSNH